MYRDRTLCRTTMGGEPMKQFEFPLQAALRVREQKQDAAHRKFASAQRDYNAATEQLRSYHQILARAQRTANNNSSNTVDVLTLLNFDGYRRKMSELIQDQTERCMSLRSDLARARRELMEACRERQTLETLRDNCQEEYTQELLHAENRELDEAGQMSFALAKDNPFSFSYSETPMEAS